jgi:hypothetical protein
MSDEFKKLDQLMQRNVPDTSMPLRTLKIPSHSSNWIKGFTVCASLVVAITVTQNRRQFNETEDIIALEQVMSWDMTTEESVSEIDEVVDFID